MEHLQGDFQAYVKYIFHATKGREFRWNEHHTVICNALMRAFAGISPRLILNLPPRFSKTELAVVSFASWALGISPDAEFIHASYSSVLAANNSYNIRSVMQHEAYREVFPDSQLQDDSKARHWWKTANGGVFYATGAEGTITGFGAGKVNADGFGGALLIDDPHKALEAKRSEASRKAVIDWFQGTVETRLNSQETPIILIMQRLHEEDLSGWLLGGGNGERWEHVSLPAIKPDGSALWPAKLGISELHRMQASKPYDFAGQYMQRPVPIGGGMVKDAWFSDRYKMIPPRVIRVVQSWDSAQKDKKERNDPSVCTTWAECADGYYLLDVYRDWLEYPALERAVKDQAAKHKPNAVLVEDKSTGQSIIQQARAGSLGNIPVIGIEPKGDKIDRLERCTGLMESGRVRLPESAQWISDYTSELTTFPMAVHDDQVDSTSQALNWMRDNSGRAYASSGHRRY
ncbi:MAG: phage terminase large subunit [Thiothrix sp.]|uniref:phage terminase large subunit n=1 Tax=Thiothrix sp. TaxID=1032 RepID=UPI00261DD494|nr:phage terminase large subunit [Thiothrix sp.]MDD5395219.1 phage terminase large subunit [Thiothrix sp.]